MILILGGTGSLGHALVKRWHKDNDLVVFSRGEDKQYRMKMEYPNVNFAIGDVRDLDSLLNVKRKYHPRLIINAAAMKHVPVCEHQPDEAVKTNAIGSLNVLKLGIKSIGISTDKACMPVNAMGMTKALMEKMYLAEGQTCVRYGNVIGSRGSVIPLFKQLIAEGEKISITDERMTRFLLPIEEAVDTVEMAIRIDEPGIVVPKCASAKIVDVAKVLGAEEYNVVGNRGGEKLHETLINECEKSEAIDEQFYFIGDGQEGLRYSSEENNLNIEELRVLLQKEGYV